jgi:Subtilase family
MRNLSYVTTLLITVLFSTTLSANSIIKKFDVALNSIVAGCEANMPLPEDIELATDGKYFPILLQFENNVFDGDVREKLEQNDVTVHPYYRHRVEPANLYPAVSTVPGLLYIAEYPAIKAAYSGIPIKSVAPLNQSAVEIWADQVWNMYAPDFQYLRGDGIMVAIADTGVDIYHPSLFRADPGNHTYSWYDNGNGFIDNSGSDWVDLNHDTIHQTHETLRFFDGRTTDWLGTVTNTDGVYQADVDWLYNDLDNSSTRDYGPPTFDDSWPCLGEMMFITEDQNSNNSLDPGELIIGLNQPKVMATYNGDGNTRSRGVDLTLSDMDTSGHGTEVSGALAGGWPGYSRYTGIAPECEILMYNRWTGIGMSQFYWWSTSHMGAQVMLWEIGAWSGLYMDGTDAMDLEVNAAEDMGIHQVVTAGNLAGYSRHASGWVDPDDNPPQASEYVFTNLPGSVSFNNVYVTIIWPHFDGTAPVFDIYDPSNSSFYFNMPSGGWHGIGSTPNHQFMAQRNANGNGTNMFHIEIQRSPSGSPLIATYFQINIHSASTNPNFFVNIYGADNATGWGGGTTLTGYNNITVNDTSTVTSPATALDAISVASYSTRTDGYGTGTTIGDISPFSGRGPRIDGLLKPDVSAPGDWDIYSPASVGESATTFIGEYREFGGTSAAAPHVAGAVALYMQFDPITYGSPSNLKTQIQNDCIGDVHTGAIPNNTWGYGKMRIAITPIYTPPPTATPTSTPTFVPTPTGTIPDTPVPTFTAAGTTTPTSSVPSLTSSSLTILLVIMTLLFIVNWTGLSKP